MTMKLDATRRMVTKAEQRERKKAAAALAKWLPMRRAQLALVPVPETSGPTDADLVDGLLSSWVKASALDEIDVETEETAS